VSLFQIGLVKDYGSNVVNSQPTPFIAFLQVLKNNSWNKNIHS